MGMEYSLFQITINPSDMCIGKPLDKFGWKGWRMANENNESERERERERDIL